MRSTAAAARPHARPVPGRGLPGERLAARLLARMPRRAMLEIVHAPRTGAPGEVRKHSLLVTFRRDGRAVPTPVWAAPAGGRLYVRTARASGKVRRLRGNPRVLVAQCTASGTPLAPPFEALAHVLDGEREHIAERALCEAYGRGRELFERWVDVLRVEMCYLELEPRRWQEGA